MPCIDLFSLTDTKQPLANIFFFNQSRPGRSRPGPPALLLALLVGRTARRLHRRRAGHAGRVRAGVRPAAGAAGFAEGGEEGRGDEGCGAGGG